MVGTLPIASALLLKSSCNHFEIMRDVATAFGFIGCARNYPDSSSDKLDSVQTMHASQTEQLPNSIVVLTIQGTDLNEYHAAMTAMVGKLKVPHPVSQSVANLNQRRCPIPGSAAFSSHILAIRTVPRSTAWPAGCNTR